LAYLLNMMLHLASDEGYEMSNTFAYLEHNANPYSYAVKRWGKQ